MMTIKNTFMNEIIERLTNSQRRTIITLLGTMKQIGATCKFQIGRYKNKSAMLTLFFDDYAITYIINGQGGFTVAGKHGLKPFDEMVIESIDPYTYFDIPQNGEINYDN